MSGTEPVTPLQIVILGGGTAGWMAANLMAREWRDRVRIRVIESPDIGIIGVGEGSTPTLKRLFEILDIPEREWMPACNATYKLSIRFQGWSPGSGIPSYGHPFTSQPDTFTERPFQVNCLTRRLGLRVNTNPEDFLLNGVLARQGRVALAPENFPFRMEYGYHFNSGLLGEFLATHAGKLGVERISAKIDRAELNERGEIDHLVAADGAEYKGDLFVDCSGFTALLIDKALGVTFRPFKDNLFNDAAVVMPTAAVPVPPVETLAVAMSAGWMWRIPLTERLGNGYVYSSDFIDADAAELELRTTLGLLESDQAARHLQMKVGQRTRHWVKNCLALGLAQGFIEPLEATALHLVQIATEEFIHLFAKGDFSARHQGDFNEFIVTRFERVRDYIVAHYKLNTRDDSDYWRANRSNENLSDTLKQLLHAWFSRAELGPEIDRLGIGDHFHSTSWHCLLAGYGAFPPLAAEQPGRGDQYVEQGVERFLHGCSLNFPRQQDVLSARGR